ncbi:hypothetical protein CTAYLR_003388 [Chrysophaeum taylorii]|uniref:Uncharacterized protein n=1 Tax=Chrysophaeum taylorii TaxID=2483200 RepID=A0AAD7U7L9_9STRA|nr:hypothetical protein CTAYLR_003388 [Chrysophaeum taylorii]
MEGKNDDNSGVSVDFSKPDTVVNATWGEVLAAAASEAPDAPFLSSWSSVEGRCVETLSFLEFYDRARAVARRLRVDWGANAGDGVALLSHPSVDLYACAAGVLVLGGQCVSLNWRQPAVVLARAAGETARAQFLIVSAAFERLADDMDSSAENGGPQYARLALARSRHNGATNTLSTSPLLESEGGHEDVKTNNGVRACDPSAPALVMFTSGSTGKPKGVPITHAGSLWACRTKLDAHGGLENVRPNGTLSFLPNFHVIGFINNFLFNMLCRAPCYVHHEAATGLLTADIFAAAASDLAPDAIDTVPAILEALGREAIDRGPDEGRELLAPFARAKMVSCGGAPLSSATYDKLSDFGVAVVPHYGQTELGGGFCLMGRPRAGRDLMRPVRGVRILVLGDDEDRLETTAAVESRLAANGDGEVIFGTADRGEIVVLGCGSATPGYANAEPPAVPFSTSRSTGDVFEVVVGADGEKWLRHVCRRDDVIIHATGELTNPLPIEDAALRALGTTEVKRVAVVGQRRPSPVMFVEEAYAGAREAMDLSKALAVANATAPAYSRISNARVIIVEPGAVPVSAKGNVVRLDLETKYAAEMDALDAELAALEEALNSRGSAGPKKRRHRHALTAKPAEEVREVVLAAATELVGGNVPTDAPLLANGLNSTGLVQLVRVLSEKLKIEGLKPTLVFDHPSVDAIVDFLVRPTDYDLDEFIPPGAATTTAAPAIASRVLRSPPDVQDSTAFLQRAVGRFDAVSEIPIRKWDVEAVETTSDKLPKHAAQSTRYGAFLDPEFESRFDGDFFRCKRVEVNAMDPQQRLLLDVGFEALHATGHTRQSLNGANVGTFTGVMNMDAPALAPKHYDLNAYVMMGSGYSALGARVSYAFAMSGPCMVFDTACSSSLIAAHVARRSLGSRECESALVAAPNLILLAGFLHLGTAIMGMNSPTGRCHTFDDRADGFVRGEGAGAMVLVPGADHPVVCRGSAARHNGRSASFTALNGASQTTLIRAALGDAGAKGVEIAYLEAHGTGTGLGDPIEVSGASTLLCGDERATPFAIGGVKANAGHAESAAGITGLIAACCAIDAGVPPPCAQLRRLNPQVRDVADLSFFAPALEQCELSAIPHLSKSKAGSSSFGWSGIIAHAICEAPARRPAAASSTVPDQEEKIETSFVVTTRPPPPALYRARYSVPRLGGRGPPRPLLHAPIVPTPSDASLVAETRVVGKLFAALRDHVIGGKILLPGVASMELALSGALAARGLGVASSPVTLALADVTFARPCVLSSETECVLTVRVGSDGDFEVSSVSAGSTAPPTTNVFGRVDESAATDDRVDAPTTARRPLQTHPADAVGLVTLKPSPSELTDKVFVPSNVSSVTLHLSTGDAMTRKLCLARDRALLSTSTDNLADAALVSGSEVSLKYASIRTRAIAALAKPHSDEVVYLVPTLKAAVVAKKEPPVVLVTFEPDSSPLLARESPLPSARPAFDVRVHVYWDAYDEKRITSRGPLEGPHNDKLVLVDAKGGRDAAGARRRVLGEEVVEMIRARAAPKKEDPAPLLLLRGAVVVASGSSALTLAAACQIASTTSDCVVVVVVERGGPVARNLAGYFETLSCASKVYCVVGGNGYPLPFPSESVVLLETASQPTRAGDGRRDAARITFAPIAAGSVLQSEARLRGSPQLIVSTSASNTAKLDSLALLSRQSFEAVLLALSSRTIAPVLKEPAAKPSGQAVSAAARKKQPRSARRRPDKKSSGDGGKAAILTTVRSIATSLAGVDVDSDAPLMEKGIDSLAATELSQTLSKNFGGIDLPATLLFDYPTPAEIAGLLASKLETAPSSPDAVDDDDDDDLEIMASPGDLDVADVAPSGWEVQVAAVGCRLPAVDSLDDLRQLTKLALDAGGGVPLSRWDASALGEKLAPDVASRASYGVFLRGVGDLDADFFRVKPLEANTLDPQQKLVLEVGYAMLRDAGKDRDALAGSQTGVFLGMMNADAGEMVPAVQDLSPFDLTGNGYSAAAARLSYVFAMRGPCQTVDTACSSTLVATHAARDALRSGEADGAVICGPNLHLHAGVSMVGGAIAAMNSVTGRCHTLDSRANGYLRAEGCGGIVLVCGEDIVPGGAKVTGLAVKHNGRAASFTALNGSAQTRLIEAAVDNARVRANDASLLEMHGTGTALGDPVEVGSASQLYAKDRTGQGIALAGIKANFGHTESSAGVAGILKALVLMIDDDVGCNAQLRVLNPQVASVLAVGTVCSVGAAPRAIKISGVSSFGFSGIISHAVLDVDAPAPAFSKVATRPLPSLYRAKRAFRYDVAPDSRLVASGKAKRASAAGTYDVDILSTRPSSPHGCAWTVTTTLTKELVQLMTDHKVNDVALFAGVGLVELGFAAVLAKARDRDAAPPFARLDNVRFMRPCVIEDKLVIACSVTASGGFEIYANGGLVCSADSSLLSSNRDEVFAAAAALSSAGKTCSASLALPAWTSSVLDSARAIEKTTKRAPIEDDVGGGGEKYTLIPTNIESVSLDVEALAYTGARTTDKIEDHRSKLVARFVATLATPKEEKADTFARLPDSPTPSYVIRSLTVKATGPPKKIEPATSEAVAYEIAWIPARESPHLVRKRRLVGDRSFEYNAFGPAAVTVVQLAGQQLPAAASLDVRAVGGAFLGITSPTRCIHAPDLPTLLAAARALEPQSVSRHLADPSQLERVSVFSTEILRDGDGSVLSFVPLERKLTIVKRQQQTAPMPVAGAVVVLGMSALAAAAAAALAIDAPILAEPDFVLKNAKVLGGKRVFACDSARTMLSRAPSISARGDVWVVGDEADASATKAIVAAQGYAASTLLFRRAEFAPFAAMIGSTHDGLRATTVFASDSMSAAKKFVALSPKNVALAETMLSCLASTLFVRLPLQLEVTRGRSTPARSPRSRAIAAPAAKTGTTTPAASSSSLSSSSSRAKSGPSKDELVASITQIAQKLIGTSPEATAPLMSSGFDSLSSTEFTKKLGIEYDLELPSTVLFEHPSISAIAGYLEDKLAPAATNAAVVRQIEATQETLTPPPPPQRTAPKQRKTRAAAVPVGVQKKATPALPKASVPVNKRDKSELVASITQIAQKLIGTAPEATAPLMSSGFDSLSSTEFTKKIGIEFDIELPSTVLFEHPSISAIATFLDSKLAPTTVDHAPATDQTVASPAEVVDDYDDYDDAPEVDADVDVAAWSRDELLDVSDMRGQVAIVAGASRGIGRAIALALAKRGCACAIFGQSTVQKVADECEALAGPGRGLGLRVDLRDKEKVEEAIAKVLATFGGRLDVLVQSASVHRGGDILNITEKGFDFVLHTNVIGTSMIMHTCAPILLKSPQPRVLLVAPGAVSAKSWLNFARGSTIYCSAKLMMGFYLELWGKAYPEISMSTLWPKYVVESAATDSRQGSNKHLQADQRKMVKPIFMGEAAALVLTRPQTTPRIGWVDYHLDADIHMAMGVGRAHRDFLNVDGKPWNELEVCFQVDVEGRKDLVEVYEVNPPPRPAATHAKKKKILVIGDVLLGDLDSIDVAVVVCGGSGAAPQLKNKEAIVSPGPADVEATLDQAIESLGTYALDAVIVASDATASAAPVEDLGAAYDRFVKFPFFVMRDLKRRRDMLRVDSVVVASAPPDVFPLANAHVTLNEVLLDRALVSLAIAIELDKEKDARNYEIRLCWPASTTFRLPASTADKTELARTALAFALDTASRDVPPASCAVIRDEPNGSPRSKELVTRLMSPAYDEVAGYSPFQPASDRKFWLSPFAAAEGGSRRHSLTTTPDVVATRFALPGYVATRDATELREFLLRGGDALGVVPQGRWETPVAGAEHSAIYGGFLGDRFAADYECTGMVAVEARWADPQQLLVLEACCGSAHEALRDEASTTFERHALAGKNVGMYLGCGGVTYGSGGLADASSLRKAAKFNLYTGTSSTLSVAAGRVPYVLGLVGPCLSIDTACCSSLVATHVAVKALAALECEAAISASVGILSEPASTAFSIAGMFSPTGRCFTFDASANGYARGEGCISYVLDPSRRRSTLSPAGVLGTSVQQDGLSASLTAPNGTAQRRLIAAVANRDDDSSSSRAWESLEAHGTGTALGDPIEVGAAAATLCDAQGRSTRATSFKANVGHLESAAAGAGLVALLATTLDAGAIAPNARLRRLNGHLSGFVRNSPFFAPVEPTLASGATAADGGRLLLNAGRLSSFGFSGTIAHARFEAPDRRETVRAVVAAETGPELFRSRALLPISPYPAGLARIQVAGAAALLPPVGGGFDLTSMDETEELDEDDDDDIEDAPAVVVDVAGIVAEVMGFEVDVQKPLMDVGLDSFVAGELMNQLSSAARAELPATLLFDYPSVASLDKFLQSDELMLVATGNDEAREERRRRRTEHRRRQQQQQQLSVISGESSSSNIQGTRAVVGSEARTPYGSPLSAIRDAHAASIIAVAEMPNSRFDEDLFARDSYPIAATYGGFVAVDDLERFAMESFGLSRAESAAMDPQQRLALEVGHSTLIRDGGYAPDDLLDANVGCYVGVQTSDFYDLARRKTSGVSATYLATGANHAVASGRLPYALGLRGASMAITTACSTALVCCHEARAGLELSADSRAALVVAVNLNLLAAMTVGVAKAGMLSPKGRCHTLDEAADGYVRSEGCVGILVRLASAAPAAKDAVVISATAVRSDGRSASLTAPSGLAQQQLLREALAEASTHDSSSSSSPDEARRTLDHVELHGTGTALGDPIEIGALSAVSTRHVVPTVAAVKANVGHSETCSGAFGIGVLVELALAAQQAAPQACLRTLNSRLTHFSERFVGPVDLAPRAKTEGGVSSFGFSGAIAHVQLGLESFPARTPEKISEVLQKNQREQDPPAEPRPLRRVHVRIPLVESRAPTPAVQRASAVAMAEEMEREKRAASVEDDLRPVVAYEVRWAPRSAAPRPKNATELADDVEGRYAPIEGLALIVGAGLDGVLCAAAFARAGVPYVVFERDNHVAGVWVTQANATSKVQTGKLTYTLDLSDPAPDVAKESNYQPADEVCTRISEFAVRFGVDTRTYLGREVLSVRYGRRHDEVFVTWRDVRTNEETETKFGAIVFACGALRAPTIAPSLQGAASFRGFDSYGVAADMAPCEMAGRDVVVAGHGAYGVENVRTGLEHGAKTITVVCRHRHSVLPRCAVWVLDAGREFDAWKEISAMLGLSKLRPEYTTDRRKRPAVSDQYYVAMRYGRAAIVHGAITGFDVGVDGRAVVVVDDTLRIPAEIALLCYGFSKETTRINEIMGVEELTGIWVNGRRTSAILKADLDVRREATPLSASNIPFATFLGNLIAQFLKRPMDFEKVKPRLPKAGVTQDTTSFDFFASMFLALVGYAEVKPQLDKIVRRVQHASVRDVMPWDAFVKDCEADWRRYVAVCKRDSTGLGGIPYADWPDRAVPPHKDGMGLAKIQQQSSSAASHWVTVVSCASDLGRLEASSKSLTSRSLALGAHLGRPAATLAIVHPRSLDDLAVLTRYAATSDAIAYAVVVLSDRLPTTPFLAQVRVARVEMPKMKLATFSYERGPRPGQLESLLARPQSADVRLGQGDKELVPTLCSWRERKTTTAAAAAKVAGPPLGGRALVTGGTGALGLVASALLLETGEASLVMIGTRQPRVRLLADPLVPRLYKLAASGRAVVVSGADTSDPEAMALFGRVNPVPDEASGQVGAVVHAAGVLHDVMLGGLEKWMADKVLVPKTAGLPALRSMVEASNRGRFVGFSSATVVLGGPGQTAYAHASGAIDAFAEEARSRGTFATTVQWLAVRGVGMHQEAVGSAPQWTPLSRVEQVLAHLVHGVYGDRTALSSPPCSVSVLPEAFLKFLPPTVDLAVEDDPSLRPGESAEQPKKKMKKKKKESKSKSEKKKNKKKSGGEDVSAVVDAALNKTLSTVVGDYDPATGADVPFMEMGVDSMGLTDFVNSLNTSLDVELPEVALFEHPTVRDLRAALLEMVAAKGGGGGGGDDDFDDDDDDDVDNDDLEYAAEELDDVAVPGSIDIRREAPKLALASMYGSLALGDLVDRGFWAQLRSGACAVGRLPLDRVHSSLLGSANPFVADPELRVRRGPGASDDDALRALDLPATARYGGFVETAQWVAFDNEAFGIAKQEARVMDPQQRQLLESGLGALEAAGISRTSIRDGLSADEPWTVGNFVALQTNDFARAIVRTPKLVASTYAVSGANPAIAAGRLGYALGLRGAAMCVDTACSTALVCLHEARLSFYDTPNEPALVSAVNAMIDASVTEVVERAGMLSPRGRCHTFDERADGYCRGEGVVSVVLRPLDATHEGVAPLGASGLADRGVEIASTSLRSDGRTASITAPSLPAQRELLLKARSTSRSPDEVLCAVECHGTGTALGDPIEIGALSSHVEKHEATTIRGLDVALGGVKANLGHLEPAAGFAGLAALVQLCDAQTVPNVQLRRLNHQLDSALSAPKSTRRVRAGVDSAMPLPMHRRRDVAGTENRSASCVSSFGFSGIIAHARVSFAAPFSSSSGDGGGGGETNGRATDVVPPQLVAEPRPSLYRKRVNYEWLEVVEPLVYGLDAHARNAPDVVGLQAVGSAPKTATTKTTRKAWDATEVHKAVRAIVESLGGDVASNGDDAEFVDMGIDSIAATELSREIASKFDLGKLPPSFVFDNPTVTTTVTAVSELLRDQQATEAAATTTTTTTTTRAAASNEHLTMFGPSRRAHRGALFLWSGGQGDASAFARLGSRLGSELRVYGVDRVPNHNVGQMADVMAPAIAACVPEGDAACYLGGLSVGGWLSVETAMRLERDYNCRVAAIFSLDGVPPVQLDTGPYEPDVGASELIRGRGFALPEGWGAMSAEKKVEKFAQLLPSLGIDFIGGDVKAGKAVDPIESISSDLVNGAKMFMKALCGGEYDEKTTRLPNTELIAFRASERNEVKMLKDSDVGAYPHIYSWATPGVPNVRVIDMPVSHMHILMHNHLLDAIAGHILANTDRRNRPG